MGEDMSVTMSFHISSHLRISTCTSIVKLYTGSYRILSRTAKVDMPFINTRNNKWHSTVPWWIPDNTGASCDVNPSTTTLGAAYSSQPITW